MIDFSFTNRILNDFLNDIRVDIISVQASKGMRASGESATGMEIRHPADMTSQLVDTKGYLEFDEYGRGPSGSGGKSGEGKTLRERVYDWLLYQKYGIDYASDKERTSISWAIATKIHKKGTYIKIEGIAPTGVLSEVINQQRIESLSQVIRREYASVISSDVVKEFKLDLQ